MNTTTTTNDTVKLATIARDGIYARIETAMRLGRTETATFRDLVSSLAYYNEVIARNS